MINVEKVKKGLGKCWKFFAAKPAYASAQYQCMYCGRQLTVGSSAWPSGSSGGRCPATGGNHVWQRIG